ncbi:MAG: hypothetical protein A2X59_09875 [Nitrospirae bacterium GWC2_42_7]|nr:MAG: hypothetical protein A2X59_09875 [Nitrospirae bacterium GWC2_42_7]
MKSMLKIIHKSVLKELFITFVLTLTFLNSILMMEKLLRLSRVLSGVGASVLDMIKIILYLQPQLLLLTIPMSLLLSILLIYGRMNMDNEIVILKVCGMNFKGISLPAMVLGLTCFVVALTVSFYLGPKSSIKLREEITAIIAERSALSIEEGTFNTSFKDIVIIVKGKKSSDTLEKIFIHDNRKKGEPRVLMAKEGRIYVQDELKIGLLLTDGYINLTKGSNTTELFFDRYKMTLSLGNESPSAKKAEFTPSELARKASEADTYKKKTSFYLELHRRFSLPFICLVLIFLGTPFSLLSGKSGRLGGLALGLLIFTFYYMALIYSENLVMTGKMPHYIGSWIPTAILGVLAFLLFRKESSR